MPDVYVPVLVLYCVAVGYLFPTVAVAVGVVVAFFVVVFIIFAISCALCFCLPGCALAAAAHGPRQRVVYQTI